MLHSFKLVFLLGFLVVSLVFRYAYSESVSSESTGVATINWGDPAQTDGDNNFAVTNTDWCLSASKEGGFWLGKDPFAWYANNEIENDLPFNQVYQSLILNFDSTLIQNKTLGLDISFTAFSNAVLEVDIFDIEGECIAQNAVGNIISQTNRNEQTSVYFEISNADYPGFTELRLTHVSGAILVYDTTVSIIDDDFSLSDSTGSQRYDENQRQINTQQGSTDLLVTDIHVLCADGTDVTLPMQRKQTGNTIYISACLGHAMYDGKSRTIDDGHGPKNRIQEGLDVCEDGGTVEVETGSYLDSTLNPGNKTVILKINGTVTL